MNRTTHLLLVSCICWLALQIGYANPIRPGKDHAIFFAVDQYQNDGFPSLEDPIRDAERLAETLKEKFGFQTEVLRNPTYQEIEAKLQAYAQAYMDRQLPQDGQLFVFFSGHGMEAHGNGYFMPTDGDPRSVVRTGLPYSYWRPFISEINCDHILVAIDACYSVTFDPDFGMRNYEKFSRKGEYSEAERVLSNHNTYQSRIFFTSDSKGNMTPGASNFARKMLEGLRDLTSPDGFITSSQLFSNYVEKAQPTPMAGDFEGDDPSATFLFFHELSEVADYEEPASPQGTTTPNASTNPRASIERIPVTNPRMEDLLLIGGGYFTMGSSGLTRGASPDEKPQRRVGTSTFYLSPAEVTVKQFSLFVERTGYRTDAERHERSLIWNGMTVQEQDDVHWRHNATGKLRPPSDYNHPVLHVSWNDAIHYCNWLSEEHGLQPVYTITEETVKLEQTANGYRLPTEAEWEYAASSGGKGHKYAGISSEKKLNLYTNFLSNSDGYNETAPVRRFRSNDLGLHDMSGNAAEWCWDWYSESYYRQGENQNPLGPETGAYRVFRGGSWHDPAEYCRTAVRGHQRPDYHSFDIGFRIARSKVNYQ